MTTVPTLAIIFGQAAMLLRQEGLRRKAEGFPNWSKELLDLADAVNRIAKADDAVEQWLQLKQEYATTLKQLSETTARAVASISGKC